MQAWLLHNPGRVTGPGHQIVGRLYQLAQRSVILFAKIASEWRGSIARAACVRSVLLALKNDSIKGPAWWS